MLKKRWVRIVLGVLLTIGGVFVGTQSASALDKPPSGADFFGYRHAYDCFPGDCGYGSYTSAVVNGNANAGAADYSTDGKYDWGIEWLQDPGQITVRAKLTDSACDNRGATLVIEEWDGVGYSVDRRELRNTDGCNTTRTRSTTFNWDAPDFNYEDAIVRVKVCNGKTSTGANEQCGAWHGDFHSY